MAKNVEKMYFPKIKERVRGKEDKTPLKNEYI